MDETGNRFRGFTDAAGSRIEKIQDETGNLFDEASNWASHTWDVAREKLHNATDALSNSADGGKHQAGKAGAAVQQQMGNLNQTIMTQFRDQPLVAGALAFALGAALGSTLPHTDQEDALMGEASDAVKGKAGEQAAEVYDQGKQKAAELYETASEKVGEIYQQAKTGLADASDKSNPS